MVTGCKPYTLLEQITGLERLAIDPTLMAYVPARPVPTNPTLRRADVPLLLTWTDLQGWADDYDPADTAGRLRRTFPVFDARRGFLRFVTEDVDHRREGAPVSEVTDHD